MDASFWHERWALGEIGFHRSSHHWALIKHWAVIATGALKPCSVLVPLCGKSLDMHHLRQLGHAVVGVELDERAVQDFFREADLVDPLTHTKLPAHALWQAGKLSLVQGDFLAFQPTLIGRPNFDLFYDRAALVALPSRQRGPYLDHLARQLSSRGRGLLITMEYDQNQRAGPPFSVMPEELSRHPSLRFTVLERREVSAEHPRLAGNQLDQLFEVAYCVEKH